MYRFKWGHYPPLSQDDRRCYLNQNLTWPTVAFEAIPDPPETVSGPKKTSDADSYCLRADLSDACLREACLATGSCDTPPTWVTYSPVTSVPRTAPVRGCSPGVEPSFQVSPALPLLSLTTRAGVTVPDFTLKLTRASGTGLP